MSVLSSLVISEISSRELIASSEAFFVAEVIVFRSSIFDLKSDMINESDSETLTLLMLILSILAMNLGIFGSMS